MRRVRDRTICSGCEALVSRVVGRRHHPHLLQQAEGVGFVPVLDDLAIPNSPDGDGAQVDLLTRRGNAEQVPYLAF